MSSRELKPIILYDISCSTPGRPWSPNTTKTRYCLGYKQLPFMTTWVEFPDIAGILQSKGITHPPYTLPTIEDPNTGAVVMDSTAIASYLDETYPETPTVSTPASREALERIGDVFLFGSSRARSTGAATDVGEHDKIPGAPNLPPLVFLVLGYERLNDVSKVYYYQTRSTRYGERWETLVKACSTSPQERTASVKQGIETIKMVLCKVTEFYDRQGELEGGELGRPFAFGKEPCSLDFMVAARVKFVLDGLTPSEAKALKFSYGKRLWQLVEDLEKYYIY